MTEPPAKKTCLGIDCENEAALQCPTCLKLGINDSYFCSQDCFKKNWVRTPLFPPLLFSFSPASRSPTESDIKKEKIDNDANAYLNTYHHL